MFSIEQNNCIVIKSHTCREHSFTWKLTDKAPQEHKPWINNSQRCFWLFISSFWQHISLTTPSLTILILLSSTWLWTNVSGFPQKCCSVLADSRCHSWTPPLFPNELTHYLSWWVAHSLLQATTKAGVPHDLASSLQERSACWHSLCS